MKYVPVAESNADFVSIRSAPSFAHVHSAFVIYSADLMETKSSFKDFESRLNSKITRNTKLTFLLITAVLLNDAFVEWAKNKPGE